MSTTPMPTSADDVTDIGYTPSQQDSNTPPGPVGVLAPPDQQQPAPAANPTANYPASPDQGGPVLQSPDPDAGSNVHGWRAVLRGALQGLESHLKGAGEGLVTGGIPGALVGAVNPAMADKAMQFRGAMQKATVQTAQAHAQTAMEQARFGAQDDPIQLAQAQINLQHLKSMYDSTSPEFQQRLIGEGQEAAAQLQRTGITPVFVGDENDATAHLNARMQVNTEAPLNTVMLPTPGKSGSFSVYEIPSDQKYFQHPVTITIGHDADGNAITKDFAPGQISISRALSLETAAMVDESKNQAKVQLQNVKNQGTANVANIKANSAQSIAASKASGKVENMLVGSLPDGTPIAGTQQDLQAAGAIGITKLPGDEGKKVVVARQLIAPNGLFASVNQDIRDLDSKGMLGVAASRWNDFLSGKVGDGPEFAKLRTDMGLLGTALMQAHVGARGSHEMLQHFQSLADYRISDAPTLRAALGREYNYVTEKAMLPKRGK